MQVQISLSCPLQMIVSCDIEMSKFGTAMDLCMNHLYFYSLFRIHLYSRFTTSDAVSKCPSTKGLRLKTSSQPLHLHPRSYTAYCRKLNANIEGRIHSTNYGYLFAHSGYDKDRDYCSLFRPDRIPHSKGECDSSSKFFREDA